jgi:eukaryotic-like serine/threonine-protein kinase
MYEGSLEPPVTCPHCGANVSAAADRCSACRRAMRGPQVAAGVLTPPPVPTPDSDADETRFIEPQATRFEPDDAVTTFADPSAISRPDSEATRFEPVDPDVTRFEPLDPDVTRFEPLDPDVTRFVDSDVTRMALEPDRPQAQRPPTPRPTTRPPTGGRSRSGARTSEGATGPLDVGQAFGERYHIIRVLGIGGMGAVYHAWDAELGMAVALKVIRPDSSSDPQAAAEMERRFKQELVLARQVTHKNVVRIHDLGEIDGIKYITMPYLEGSDLATVLKEGGKMPVPKALAIIRDVAAGLSAAHDVGIVHRDLKPANIMVLKDHAVIMDFGIARSNQLPQEASAHLAPAEAIDSLKSAVAKTLVGTILGTVQYMAPEQAKGQDVDQRADIYALGLIFLDMLLGKRHTHASSAIEELKTRIEQPPPLAQTLDPSIPKPIEQVIARCLEPDREKRFATSAELVATLDRIDDKGELIPIKRTIRLPYAIAVVVLLLAISVGVWWYQRQFIPPAQHDPVSVVIADFQNNTNDPTFNNTLGLTLKRALEGASFITAFDRTRIRPTFGVQPPEKFDEKAARQLAINQGLGIVVAAGIAPSGNGYEVSVQAIQALTGKVIAEFSRRASSKDQVLDAVTRTVANVRTALGDETSDSAQLLAMRSISTTSLDVASHYASALEFQSQAKYEEALREFSTTTKLDPTFGLGYQGMAAMSRTIGQLQDAEKYAGEAIKYLDKMTERERFQTRGNYAMRTGDYNQCVKEYGDMISQYPADVVAHNQRALCLVSLQDMRGAVEEMRQVVRILPNHVVFRTNLGLFLSYNSEFTAAEQELRNLKEPNPRSLAALAFSLLGQGRVSDAADMYGQLAKTGAFGESFAPAGLGDLAVYQGRFSDAVKIFEEGAKADIEGKRRDAAAMKLAALAYAHFSNNQKSRAAAAAERALQYSTVAPVRFLTARIFAQTGNAARARQLAGEFGKRLGAENQAYAKIIDGLIELENGNAIQAIKTLTDANAILDTWLGRFDLGRAYFEAKGFLQADAEFDHCLQRRGVAIALVQEDPTFGYLPVVYYYRGRVREELKTAGFADSYQEYVKIRGQSKEDPLVRDARRRAGI